MFLKGDVSYQLSVSNGDYILYKLFRFQYPFQNYSFFVGINIKIVSTTLVNAIDLVQWASHDFSCPYENMDNFFHIMEVWYY